MPNESPDLKIVTRVHRIISCVNANCKGFALQGSVYIHDVVISCFMLICCVCFFCSTVRWTPIPCPSMSCTLSGTLSLRWENLSCLHILLWGLLVIGMSAVLWYTKTSLLTFWILRVCCPSLSHQFLPTWLAPNLITFTGFMFLVLNFVMLAFYDFDFNASGKFSLLPEYYSPNVSNEVTLWIIFKF